jgi:excinuclease UvrABC nuclease subunit
VTSTTTSPSAGRTGVYRLFDAEGSLLYVGLTCDPDGRWRQHSHQKPWFKSVDRHTVEWHDTRIEARRAEVVAIKTEGPLYNRQDVRHSEIRDYIPHAALTVTQPARAALDDLILLAKPKRRFGYYRTSMSVAVLAAAKVVHNHLDEYRVAVAEAQDEWDEIRTQAKERRLATARRVLGNDDESEG